MKLIITIDTEEDNWTSYSPMDYTLANIEQIPSVQQLFNDFNIIPTYLITHPVATDQKSISILKTILENNQCEIGAHCHPWNTPPFGEVKNEKNSMLCNLPADLQYRKIKFLHEMIKKNFDIEPISFRSGRWGYSQEVAQNLHRLGYKIDTSVTPYTDWTSDHGPDFSNISPLPFRFSSENIFHESSNGHLLEVPATIGFLPKNFALSNSILKALGRTPINRLRLAGILGRLNLLKKVWLSPEVSDSKSMIRLTQYMIRNNYNLINMVFHSSSLKAGLTPFVRTKEDERRFIQRIKEFLIFARENGIESIKLSDALKLVPSGTAERDNLLKLTMPERNLVKPVPPNYSASNVRRLKRVLFLVNLDPTLKYGSLEEQTFSLAKAFHDGGSLFLPLFLRPMREQDHARYQAVGLGVGHLDLQQFTLSTFLRLLRIINDNKIEIVHWNFYSPINLYIVLLKILKPRVIHYMTDHTSRSSRSDHSTGRVKRTVRKALFRCYSKILCVSDFILADLTREGLWTSLSRYHHFINTTRFRPDESVKARIRKDLGEEKPFVILVVAHLIPEKGVDVALKALRELPSHAVLWIVGDGHQRAALQELTKELQLYQRVAFWGLQRNVAPYMQAADCLVCPSRWDEAAGLVILEAFGCGLPVIATRVGGIPEFIEDEKTGFLFPPGDHTALAERIGRLLHSPHLVRTMGKQARSTVVDRFSAQKLLTKVLSDYEEVTPWIVN